MKNENRLLELMTLPKIENCRFLFYLENNQRSHFDVIQVNALDDTIP